MSIAAREFFEQVTRGMQAITDSARLSLDAMTRAFRLEWEHPERLLTDDERDEIHARQMGRTLVDIDALPTTAEDEP